MKKFTSLLISASLFLQTSNFRVFAGGDGPDPTADPKIVDAVKKHFNGQVKDISGEIKPITYPKAEEEIVLQGGHVQKLDAIIDPKRYKDHRVIKFYNIPALLAEDKTVTSQFYGSPTGNIPLKLMVEIYLDGEEECNKILERLKDKKFKEKMVAFSEEFVSKVQTNPSFKENVLELARRIGTSEEIAEKACSQLFITKHLADELASNADELKDIKYRLAKTFKTLAIPGIPIVGSAGVCALTVPMIKAGAAVGTAIFPGVGTVIGGFLGCAVLVVMGTVTEVTLGLAAKVADDYVEKIDESSMEKAQGAIASYKASMEEQKALNYASLLSQMMHFMIHEPNKVMNSNIFVTAVDHRSFVNWEDLEKSGDYSSARKLDCTPDQGAWCDFKYVPDLENAPRAKDYKTEDNRHIGYLIAIFRETCSPSGNKIDFNALKQYANGSRVPFMFISDAVGQIREYIEDGVPKEKIVERITNKYFKGSSDDLLRKEILQTIEQETLQVQLK